MVPANEASWYDVHDMQTERKAKVLNLVDGDRLFKIKFTIDADIKKYTRQIYSGLDLIGDVGGLLDGLRLLGYMILGVLQFIFGSTFESYLLNKLYK